MMLKYNRIYSSWSSLVGRSNSRARSGASSTTPPSPNHRQFSQRTLMLLAKQQDGTTRNSQSISSFYHQDLLSTTNRNFNILSHSSNIDDVSRNTRYLHVSSVVFNDLRDGVVPALAESLSEGDLRWLKAVGDTVTRDEIVGEIETDKTTVPIRSPADGVVAELLVEDGSTVQPGKVVFRIRVSGGAGAAPAAAAEAAPAAAPEAAAAAPAAAAAGTGEIRDIVVPALAESLSEGDIHWLKAVGDTVTRDEIVGEVETDKTNVPIHSPVAGVVEELLVEDGSTVQPGKVVLRIRVGAAGAAAPAKAAAAPAAEPSQKPLSVSTVEQVKAAAQTLKAPPTPAPAAAEPMKIGTRGESRVKMNRMRQRIAQRLKDAQNTYAMLTTFNEVDMTNIIDMRNRYKDTFAKKHNLKLSFMSAFIKATAFALQDQPVVNAVIEGDETLYRDYIDISVAVATPKGLVVPVIRNVETMNFAQIERAMAELGDKAKKNALSIEDMDGGTFTISNGGVFGSMFGTPIINPPQSAILGMHAIIDRPVVIDKKIEIRPMMYVCLTYDHRLIDGREAVTFLRKIKAAVEDPRVLLLDV